MLRSVRRSAVALAALLSLTAAACTTTTDDASPTSTTAGGTVSGTAFDAIAKEARGQTVNWYMFGGSETINGFVNGFVATALKEKYDVTLNQVKVTDTVEAVNKVLGEKQAGKTSDGSVDAIWINGENFASGKQADLWECGYPKDLPSFKNVDVANPNITTDFGLAVDGCESPWQQANSALVYDSAKLGAADVTSMTALFDWAKAHPGQLTYPAPPDFTGSMFVRTAFYDTNGGPTPYLGSFDETKYKPAADKTWARLNELKPALWMQGTTYPQTQTEVAKLYAEGTVAAFLTYGPGLVGKEVDKGTYPKTTREAVFTSGNIGNISFLAVPKNAAHKAAGKVLAEVLLSPAGQLEYYKQTGGLPAISPDRAGAEFKQQFDAVPVSASVLPLADLSKNALPELQKQYVTKIEQDWKTNVLQRVSPKTQRRRRLRIWLLLFPALAVVVVLFLGGLGLGLAQSFGYLPFLGSSTWSLDAYRATFDDPAVRASLVLTLRTALLATLISAVLGVSGALLVRSTQRGRRLASAVFQYNLSVPHSVGALCMLLLLQQSGLLARLADAAGLTSAREEFPVIIRDRFGWGIIAEFVWKETPFIGVVVLAALSSGVRDLEDAARMLGAGPLQRFRLVVLPLIAPGLVATSIIVFAFSFGSYEVPFLLGRPFPATLPVVSYQYYRDIDLNARPQAMAISVCIAAFVGTLVVAYSAALDRFVRRTG